MSPARMNEAASSERAVVLMYHRVGDANNSWEKKYCISPEMFSRHMCALYRAKMVPCTIDDFVAWMLGKKQLAEKSFLLTFDDGFKGVYDYAAPVLKELGWPATIFLVADLIGKTDAWCSNFNPSGHTYPLMSYSEIGELSMQGFDFHSHTCTHPDLSSLADDAVSDELSRSRQIIQKLSTSSVDYIAYPYGKYDDRVLSAAKKTGYAAGFSVRPGFNRPGQSLMEIRRLDVFGTDSPNMLLRKVRLGSNNGGYFNMLNYYLRRLIRY